MTRRKTNPDELYVRELRITPPDQQPIVDWKVTAEDFKKVIACKEGGPDTGKALHYHLYIESFRSESWIKKWVYSIAHCYNGEQGNSVFFSRKPHDNTIGYVVKHGDVAFRHGVEETFITEWIAKSEQYKRDKLAESKRKQRVEKSFSRDVVEMVAKTLRDFPQHRNPKDVLDCILCEYYGSGRLFPTRTTVENMITTLLFPYNPDISYAFYLRSFEPRY